MAENVIARQGLLNSDEGNPGRRGPKEPKKINRLAYGLILVALAIWPGCSKKESGEVAPTVTVQVATAETEKIERKISADAVIFPPRQAALTPKISAPVRKFFVERGSHVHAGELLAQLEDQDLVAAVTDNKGAYEQAEAAYETATKQALPEEIQKAELDVRAAREAMQSARKVYEGQQNLFKQGATARKNVDDANLAFVQARNQYDLLRKHLESLQKLGKEQELKAAEGQLTSARGKYLGAQAQLSFAELRSPIDGVVTDRPVYPGEMAAAGSPLITVMDLSHVVARAHIDQQQAAWLRVGNVATIAAPVITDDVAGKVTMVSPALDPGSTTVEVWVQAANPDERMRPGGSVHLTIIAETVPKAVVIRAVAVLTGPDGGTSVMVVDADNKPHQKTVKIGIRDGDDAQVTEGLQAGERVVTVGAYDLFKEAPDVLEKTKVQIETPATAETEKGGQKE
ncbi:MAG: efflux RND transporter periplasmic adaptor subunit [Terriglobia bacterium]